MATSNEVSNNDADMLQFLEEDKNTKKNDTPLSQLYNPVPPIEKAPSKQKNRKKHERTDLEAGFVMNVDLTDKKSMPSVQGSIPQQSINTSRYSRRNIDHDEVLLTWDETAMRGLTKEEQSKVYDKLKSKFRIG